MPKVILAVSMAAFFTLACMSCGADSSSELSFDEPQNRLIGRWVGVWRSDTSRGGYNYGCGPIKIEIERGLSATGTLGWAVRGFRLTDEECLDVKPKYSGTARGNITAASDGTIAFTFDSLIGTGVGEISGDAISGSAFLVPPLINYTRKLLTFDGEFHEECVTGRFQIAGVHSAAVEICRRPGS